MSKYNENEQKILETLGYLSMLFPNFQMKPAIAAAYLTILRDLSAESVSRAAQQLGTERRAFMPSAGEIRQTAFDLHEQAEGVLSAYEAWGQIVGGSPGYDPLTKQAYEMIGGNQAWGVSNDPAHEAAFRHRFIAAYEDLVKRVRHQHRMLPDTRLYVDKLVDGRVDSAIKKLLTGDENK